MGGDVQEVKLPEMGEGVESAEVARVLVSVGDVVEQDQPVIEVETEKANLEVPAEEGGVVSELRVKPGDTIVVRAPEINLTSDDGVQTTLARGTELRVTGVEGDRVSLAAVGRAGGVRPFSSMGINLSLLKILGQNNYRYAKKERIAASGRQASARRVTACPG